MVCGGFGSVGGVVVYGVCVCVCGRVCVSGVREREEGVYVEGCGGVCVWVGGVEVCVVWRVVCCGCVGACGVCACV